VNEIVQVVPAEQSGVGFADTATALIGESVEIRTARIKPVLRSDFIPLV
jgi:hypothetical protein